MFEQKIQQQTDCVKLNSWTKIAIAAMYTWNWYGYKIQNTEYKHKCGLLVTKHSSIKKGNEWRKKNLIISLFTGGQWTNENANTLHCILQYVITIERIM